MDDIAEYVQDPKKISQHSFYPLINYSIKHKKIRKNEHNKLIPKIKTRPISYAAHLDSQVYSYYSFLLSQRYEQMLTKTIADESVLAFRKMGKSNVDFALDAFNEIDKSAPCTAIAIDITGFFDNLDHQTLKEAWCRLIGTSRLPPDHYNLFKSLTKHCSVDRDSLYEALSIPKNNPKSQGLRICTPKQFRENIRSKGLLSVNTMNRPGLSGDSRV